MSLKLNITFSLLKPEDQKPKKVILDVAYFRPRWGEKNWPMIPLALVYLLEPFTPGFKRPILRYIKDYDVNERPFDALGKWSFPKGPL